MICEKLSKLLHRHPTIRFGKGPLRKVHVFENIVGYEGIKRTFLRSLNSKDPVHILLVGPPGQAKSLFVKSILEAYGEKKAFFTVGGNASKSGMIDILFDM
jgi:holliday junction DNA helicase RuvB